MPDDALAILVKLSMDGRLMPGQPRFDPTMVVDVVADGDSVLFNMGYTFVRFRMDELRTEEASVACKYLTEKRMRREYNSPFDPRPWNQPVWAQEYGFYMYVIFGIIIVFIFIILIMIATS